jgi:low temperature requirement protein LtrA
VRDVILIGHLILVLGLLLLAAGFNAAIDSAGAVSVPAATTIGISGGTVLVLAAQALIALRAGAPALRTSLWMFSLALTAAIPLASGPVAAFSSFGIACWALAIQGAVVILFWHGRVRDQRPPED